jgi:hypothetical protein
MIADTLNRAGLGSSNFIEPTTQVIESAAFESALSSGIAANVASEFGEAFFGFQKGGLVPGVTDVIPAMLSPGEFVFSEGAASAIGIDALRQMNATGTMGGRGVTNITEFSEGAIQLNIETQNVDDDFIRGPMMEIIKQELRTATNDGQAIISSEGVF